MKIINRKAFFEYEILETFEAGINLFGNEVKSVRLGKADLAGSFVKVIGSEIYLINAKIWEYQPGQIEGRSEEHTPELKSHVNLVCRLLLEKNKQRQLSTTSNCIQMRNTLFLPSKSHP